VPCPFERQHVKAFFLRSTKWYRQSASIKIVAEKLGIHQSEIIAVGNAGNDLAMIEYAGLGVWVDNVDPELRDRADFIVASNNNHGVAGSTQIYFELKLFYFLCFY
jgi:hydroxymethylpyrimidine pyrophosphatase-like HAD family hydrolase